ncbi:MAG: hypothetical protein ABIP20_20080 [Chthoniobacteraceae bacterium]
MLRRLFKKLFVPPMVILAATFMFFEEWLWDHLTTFMAWVARARVFRWLEARLSTLPPYGAMAVFLVPGVMLLPVKIAALYLMTRGHAGAGLAIIIAAKVVGTAIVARIFTVCRPSLLTVRWFRRLYEWIARVKKRLYSAIKAMPAWATAVRWKNAIKARVFRGGSISRQWKAIGQLLRRKFLRKS